MQHCAQKLAAATPQGASILAVGAASATASAAAGGSGQQRITKFVVDAATAEAIKDNWCRLFYEAVGSVPLMLTEHPRAKKIFELLGLKPVSREYLAGEKLDAVFKETKEQMLADLEAGDGFFQIAADGWRSKLVDEGDKLINIMVLLPGGGCMFVEVVRVKASVVDTEYLAETLWAAALRIVDDDTEQLEARLLGFILDAEAVNGAAQRKLKAKMGALQNLLCQAHGLSNLVKDVCKECTAIERIVSQAKQVVAVFTDKPVARKLLREEQAARYAVSKLLTTPPETRFAYTLEMLRDIIRNEQALRSVVMCPAFEDTYTDDDKVCMRMR